MSEDVTAIFETTFDDKMSAIQDFDSLYALIKKIQESEPDFCPPEMLDMISTFKETGVAPTFLLHSITRDHNLRTTVQRLVTEKKPTA